MNYGALPIIGIRHQSRAETESIRKQNKHRYLLWQALFGHRTGGAGESCPAGRVTDPPLRDVIRFLLNDRNIKSKICQLEKDKTISGDTLKLFQSIILFAEC
jgi:hypothetical protein